MIIIQTYNRPEMLSNLLNELGHCVVVDDGSQYDAEPFADRCDYYRFTHKGKEGFYLQWQYIFDICRESDDDWFMFIQDDVSNVYMKGIKDVCSQLGEEYAFNFMRRGKDRGWTLIKQKKTDFGFQVGYVDCNFCTTRKTLEKINFHIEPVDVSRFQRPNISSGVGQQLSRKFAWKNIPMYIPKKSFAYHGDHESIMHPSERKTNPLISI